MNQLPGGTEELRGAVLLGFQLYRIFSCNNTLELRITAECAGHLLMKAACPIFDQVLGNNGIPNFFRAERFGRTAEDLPDGFAQCGAS